MTDQSFADPGLTTPEQRRGIRLTLVVIVLFIAVVLGLFLHKITTPRVLSAIELRANGTVVFERPRVLEPFQLRDQYGEPFTLAQLKGQWTLLFPGFTACPDVCPATLSVLRDALAQLQPEIAAQTRVVLVTVDPARDTPPQLARYLAYFNPEFTGLTGEFLDIKRFTNQLNMAFAKVRTGPGDEDYSVDHSAHIAIVNPYGHYHGFIKSPPDAARIKLTLQSIVTTF